MQLRFLLHRIAFLTITLACFSSNALPAQIPSIAEDISPLLIGEIIPETQLYDMEGKGVALQPLLETKPTVLIFYRGGWCPFCNRHLGEVAQITDTIFSMGYQIIAVSPDVVPGLREATIEEDGIRYQLLADPDCAFAQAMGIAFQAPERHFDRLAERSGGTNAGVLPVPSLFVVSTDGEILFEHISPNYKERISSRLLLSVLAGLQD